MLADYKVERREIKVKGAPFFVRGLATKDVASLIRTHLIDLELLFGIYEKAGALGNDGDALILGMLDDVPQLAAEIIAIASDEPDAVDQAASLPLPTQIQALEIIAKLTFEEAGGVKKFFLSAAKIFTIAKKETPADVAKKLRKAR